MRGYILVLLVCISLFSLTSSKGGRGGGGGSRGGGGGSRGSSSGGWGGGSKTGLSSSGWGGGSKTGSSSSGWGGGSKSKTGTGSSGGWGGGRKTGSGGGGSGIRNTNTGGGGFGGGSRKTGGGGMFGGGSKGSKTKSKSFLSRNAKTILGVGVGAFAGYQLGKAVHSFQHGGMNYYMGDRYYNTPAGYIRCSYSIAGNPQYSQFRYDDQPNQPISEMVYSCPRNQRCCGAECCGLNDYGYGGSAGYGRYRFSPWHALVPIIIILLLCCCGAFIFFKVCKKGLGGLFGGSRRNAEQTYAAVSADPNVQYSNGGGSDYVGWQSGQQQPPAYNPNNYGGGFTDYPAKA